MQHNRCNDTGWKEKNTGARSWKYGDTKQCPQQKATHNNEPKQGFALD